MDIKRRTFLQVSAISSVGAMLGCSSDVGKILFPMVKASDDAVAGKDILYATTCRECPAGCGILVKTRDGRAVKVEGNPLHPVNRGKICMRGQAAVQGVYHPDRLTRPLLKENGRFRAVGMDQALAGLAEKIDAAVARGPNRVRMMTELTGESLGALFKAASERWHSDPPFIFEPFACESLKNACRILFGQSVIPDYAIHKSDLLISFGADFLETWLSPVSYARRFKEMHAYASGKKGRFFHISPHQSLTAANADQWICCRPGYEHYVALWLIGEQLKNSRSGNLPGDTATWLQAVVSPYTSRVVTEKTGIEPFELDTLAAAFKASEAPLVLGSNAPNGKHSLAVDLSALLLNLAVNADLPLLNFDGGYRLVEAAGPQDAVAFFDALVSQPAEVLILHRANPLYTLPNASSVRNALANDDLFVVCLTDIIDDTAQFADLLIPISHPLESWDEFVSLRGTTSSLQPVMPGPENVFQAGDVILQTAFGGKRPAEDYKTFVVNHLSRRGLLESEGEWVQGLRKGGFFPETDSAAGGSEPAPLMTRENGALAQRTLTDAEHPHLPSSEETGLLFIAAPSIRFYDGRSGYAPWMSEVPDPLTCVAWQTPALLHPDALRRLGISHAEPVVLETQWGAVEAVAYETEGVHPGTVVMWIGQGHEGGGRYANGIGANPMALLPAAGNAEKGPGVPVTIRKIKKEVSLAHTDGSRIQHGRKIALSIGLDALREAKARHGAPAAHGLTMHDFPLTLPLPEGYDPQRDIYPPHDHVGYRWGMVVDLDRCVGCGACAVACYAENNIGIVGEQRIIEGREMAWMRVERYHDMEDAHKITFLPMMCQHCDNAPCESVCPVYAPHHSKEGLNNQIYNRCIGTRFCSQNCPYKVRRFNWLDMQWPKPLNRQLNPDVTVRAKGVMEKCSFCIQRIKAAHGRAKDESRTIRDGEVMPACVQTCPTDALVFGNLMDTGSRVRRLAQDPRAYQVMGYLNTKPAVIYLKKVVNKV